MWWLSRARLAGWKNSTILRGDLHDEVTKLKEFVVGSFAAPPGPS